MFVFFSVIHRNKPGESRKNEEAEKFVPKKKKTKISGKDLNDMVMEISNLPDKELKVIVIKMLAKLGRRMDKHSKNFKKQNM